MIAQKVTPNGVRRLPECFFLAAKQPQSRWPVDLFTRENSLLRLLYSDIHDSLARGRLSPVGFNVFGWTAHDHLGDGQLDFGQQAAPLAEKTGFQLGQSFVEDGPVH
jgi:hypothetical protein